MAPLAPGWAAMLNKIKAAAGQLGDAASKKANVAEAQWQKRLKGEQILGAKKTFGLESYDLVAAGRFDEVLQLRLKHQATVDAANERIRACEEIIASGGERAPPPRAPGDGPPSEGGNASVDVSTDPFMTDSSKGGGKGSGGY